MGSDVGSYHVEGVILRRPIADLFETWALYDLL